ncbi:molybdopterin-guanine dinucleotide biosynthesis protein MobB [Vallitalea pronyensis]|uniref:Molybdopterin-guanine dinucleotide biosynthesis protein MobB n=1 Tax=Vallitalea pronyensis TaxID=1348613 RepID=A0A8J8MIW6_9FIRM|nr:molybdopterin-guanine dinucleotide biosynthesis protein MobB [Vallitalea pronyensis]QUI22341.1 molybdopterin-guanine dinucleotide biosynthesis protein MobB [Vallitalea pronyensis]
MKVFSVVGYTKSGKTTTIESIIRELKKRRYSVGTVKDIHYEQFEMDTEGSNTHRHKQAGAELITARGFHETDILFQERLGIHRIASFYDVDYLILEGVSDSIVPKIVTADKVSDIEEKWDDTTFLISGKIADVMDDYKGYEAISAIKNVSRLVDIIEEKTFELLPDYDEACCNACGYSCRELCKRILKGQKKRQDCVIGQGHITLKINGQVITMVPFVQKILKNAILGVVGELEGYTSNGTITIDMQNDKYD